MYHRDGIAKSIMTRPSGKKRPVALIGAIRNRRSWLMGEPSRFLAAVTAAVTVFAFTLAPAPAST
jgi:hypothetical protein